MLVNGLGVVDIVTLLSVSYFTTGTAALVTGFTSATGVGFGSAFNISTAEPSASLSA
jgi:hypothetical protein